MRNSLERHLADYAAAFLRNDPEFDRNIRLKLAHSLRVRDEARRIAAAESFPTREAELAEFAALLHDYSRFEQFSKFRTFNDAESFDHGEISARLVAGEQLLEPRTTPEERNRILDAIRVHNKVAIPPGFAEPERRLAAVVRDADKIDILPILLDYLEHPDNESIVFGLSREPRLSPAVRDALRQGCSPAHRDMRTVCDFVAGKLAWVYDLNYPAARAEFRRRNYLERLRSHLPDTGEIDEVYRNALKQLEG